MSCKKGKKHKANRCFKIRLCVVHMKLLKHILLVINNLTKVTTSNNLIKHLLLEVIS